MNSFYFRYSIHCVSEEWNVGRNNDPYFNNRAIFVYCASSDVII